MPYETFLFDLDGTLLDSIDLIFRCYRHTATVHLPDPPPDDVWRSGFGTPLRAQFRAVTDDAELIEAMVVTYREHFLEHHDQSVRLFPEVTSVLESLAGRGVRMGVVTSKLRMGTARGLEVTGLTQTFGTVVAADDVDNPKPHPEPVEKAMRALGADPETTVFVGDSPHDIAAGRAAGTATAAALWGPFPREQLESAGARHFLRSPAEILEL